MGTRSKTNEQAIESLRRRNADLEVLYETVKDLTSTLSVERVLQRLLDRTLQHLEAEIGSILLLGDDDRLRVMVSQGLPPDVVERTEMKIGEGISGHVALHGEPLIVEDVEEHPTFRRRNRERYYTSTLISAPLLRNGILLGVININNKTNRKAFEPHDLRLLEAISATPENTKTRCASRRLMGSPDSQITATSTRRSSARSNGPGDTSAALRS
jgi:signal transduction protein with GAF and PtsI domain